MDKYLKLEFFLIPALTGDKPSLGQFIKGCDATDLGESTEKFEHPIKIENNASVTFYCNTDNCNGEKPFNSFLRKNVAETIAAMKAVGTVKAGAAQTTVAVATIAFSMAMARLAL